MNGVHDMGGLQCFGPVVAEHNEPVFHHEWERRALAITLAMGASGRWNIDTLRFTRESLPPAEYLSIPYYQIWFDALEKLLIRTGMATAAEIKSGTMQEPGLPMKALDAEAVDRIFSKGWPSKRHLEVPAKYKVGDRVRTKDINIPTHTRLPRYCRSKVGEVVLIHGGHVLPDSNAVCKGEHPEWLYTVRFDAAELWGSDTTADYVQVDCWESYIEGVEL